MRIIEDRAILHCSCPSATV